MSEKKKESHSLEQNLEALEAIVKQLENGDLPLEKALKLFERGIELTRACQQSLEEAQQKVEILTQKSRDAEPEPFDPDTLP